MMETGHLLAEKLICPKCLFFVAEPTGKANGTYCPRCNTWLDLDPQCLGSCLSCHKTNQVNPSPCLTDSHAIAVKLERSYGTKLSDVKRLVNATLHKLLGK